MQTVFFPAALYCKSERTRKASGTNQADQTTSRVSDQMSVLGRVQMVPARSEGKVRVTQWVKLDPSWNWLRLQRRAAHRQGLFQLKLMLADRGITSGFRVAGHIWTQHMVSQAAPGIIRLQNDRNRATRTGSVRNHNTNLSHCYSQINLLKFVFFFSLNIYKKTKKKSIFFN